MLRAVEQIGMGSGVMTDNVFVFAVKIGFTV
jgi:hypothetical protein